MKLHPIICASLALSLSSMVACGGGGSAPTAETDKVNSGSDGSEGYEPGDHRAGPPPMEQDPNEGLEIEGLRGTIASEDINQAVSDNSDKLSACYYDHLRKQKYLAGSLEFGFRIHRDGSVKWVRLLKSDVGSLAVHQCVLGVANAMQFAKPTGGEAEFSFPLEFQGAKKRLQYWGEEEASSELSEDKMATLSSCTGAPSKGALVTMYVGRRGVIMDIGIVAADGGELSSEWLACADAAVRAWTMSDPHGRIAKMTFQVGG